jgi:selenide,water dikinase
VLVGPETNDDAGVYLQNGHGLVATADFITPVCDDPRRFGRVAATNALSDVFAMGGRALFALNLCCFPERVPKEALTEILRGGAEALREAGADLLGGHTVQDKELKYGLAVVGLADPDRLMTVAGARAGDRLVLSKPLGTGAAINAFKGDKLDADGLEPALVEMERSNAEASKLALEYSAAGCTDITGFGLAYHALNVARASGVQLRIEFERIPAHEAFYAAVARGVSTGSTGPNRESAQDAVTFQAELSEAQQQLLFDPQTSGGLLVSLPADHAPRLLKALVDTGHRAAEIGEVLTGPPGITIV